MAEEQSDKEQRTEEATSKRTFEARREGQLPVSQEVRSWFMLLAGLFVLLVMAPKVAHALMESLSVYFAIPEQIFVGDGGVSKALSDTFWHLFPSISVTVAILVFAAIIGTVSQTGFYFSATLAEPKLSRLSWMSGWRKLFTPQNLLETLKGFAKISIVGFVMYRILRPLVLNSESFVGMEPALQVTVLYKVIVKLVFVAVLFLTFYAFIDWIYQRHRYNEALKMTKQEVKDEHKQSEGDPVARNRLRQVRMERARRRMMAKVPEADVVITNPTHFAVALEYKPESMHAPRLIAKGQDIIALKIREVAELNEVPIVENPPLARALHASCELDQEVPVEHYKAVAEVISYVYRLKNKSITR